MLSTVMTKKIKKTRDAKKTRAEILQVAFIEIFKKGFQGASVDDILSQTNLTKGAFFHHFPSKQTLGYAIVDETLKDMTYQRWIQPLEDYENPLQGIVANLKQVIDSSQDATFGLGCPLNNLIQEMSNVDTVFRNKLRAVLEFWIEGVEYHLKIAKERGYIKKGVNLHHLAEFIVMNHEGAFGMTKSFRDKKVFLSLHASLKEYLKTVAA
jgi:TetR/AcrR family transcriptional repressor of nem operon